MTNRHEDDTKKVPTQPQELPQLEDFKGVLGWVEKKKDESKTSGKPWGWVMGLLAALVVFIALAFAAYMMWKKGKEIAKLKHKIDVDEELKKQAEVNAKIQINMLERRSLEKEAEDIQTQIHNTKVDIKKLEIERKKEQAKINKITSWEDVDQLLK